MTQEEYINRNLQGFEGDSIMFEKFKKIVKDYKIHSIIELGTYLGGTTRKLGEMNKPIYSCEINPEYYKKAREYNKYLHNVTIVNQNSIDFLKTYLPTLIQRTNKLFFIDSHWNDYLPLLDELKIIAEFKEKPVIAIHDFLVPNKPELGFDQYKEIILQWSYIEKAIIDIYGEKGFNYEYNSEAEGAKRGIVYIYPKNNG